MLLSDFACSVETAEAYALKLCCGCKQVTRQQRDTLSFDIIMETLRATNLGKLEHGSEVNFER